MSLSSVTKIFAAAFIVVTFPDFSRAADLTLQWDAATDGITAGYILMYGATPGSYSQQLNVGYTTSQTVAGLTGGATYYFVVRAYDATGALSDPSAEASATVALTVPPTITALALTA